MVLDRWHRPLVLPGAQATYFYIFSHHKDFETVILSVSTGLAYYKPRLASNFLFAVSSMKTASLPSLLCLAPSFTGQVSSSNMR